MEYIAPASRILKRSPNPRKLFFKDGETQTKQLSKGDAFGGLNSEKPEEKRKITIYHSQVETMCAIIKYKDYLTIAGKKFIISSLSSLHRRSICKEAFSEYFIYVRASYFSTLESS